MEALANAPQKASSKVLKAALAYIANGAYVLPVNPDKTPALSNGFLGASNDPADTYRWFGDDAPETQIAIACAMSDIVIVDVDDHDKFSEYVAQYGLTIPKTRTVRTPSGGIHLYFRAKKGFRYPRKLCEGIDLLHNGYAMAPPSRGYSKRGGTYGKYRLIDGSEIADAPDWLHVVEEPTKDILRPEHRVHEALPPDLDEISELLHFLDPDMGYDDWRSVLMSVHSATGGSVEGCRLVDDWSAGGAKYKPDEVEKKWTGFRVGGGVGIGTLAKMAQVSGADLSAISRRARIRRLSEQGKSCSTSSGVIDISSLLAGEATLREGAEPECDAATGTAPPHPAPVSAALAAQDEAKTRAAAIAKACLKASAAKPMLASSYLVKGLLQERSIAMLYGPSGIGKSFVSLNIAHAVAADRPWNGCRVNGGTVVYISAEGGGSVENRICALEGPECDNLIVCKEPIDLYASDLDIVALEMVIREMNVGLPPIKLLVIDTLARSFGAGDENTSAAMNLVVSRVTKLSMKLDATVLIVHHTGKDLERGARGSSALKAAVDTEICAKRENGHTVIQATKQRDLETGGAFCYDLEVVELGKDADGDTVTSCRVVFSDSGHAPAPESLTPTEDRTLRILKDHIRTHGTDTLTGLSGDDDACRRVVSKSEFFAHGLVGLEGKELQRRKRQMRDGLNGLVDKGVIAKEEDDLWLPP